MMSKKTTKTLPLLGNSGSGSCRSKKHGSNFEKEKQQYYSYLGICNPFPPKSRDQHKTTDSSFDVILPSVPNTCQLLLLPEEKALSKRKISCPSRKSTHLSVQQTEVSEMKNSKSKISSLSRKTPQCNITRKESEETQLLLEQLDLDAQETTTTHEVTITSLPERTPEPELLYDFPEFRTGATSTKQRVRRHSYEPRYCWCTRCQIMFRMYKEDDSSLKGWGNYPCFHH